MTNDGTLTDSRNSAPVNAPWGEAKNMAKALNFPLFWLADGADLPPLLLRLPFLRLANRAGIGVPIFAFFDGLLLRVVRKLRKLAHHNVQQNKSCQTAFQSIARSAFHRPLRLVLLALIATFISFILSALGCLHHSKPMRQRLGPVRRSRSAAVLGECPEIVPRYSQRGQTRINPLIGINGLCTRCWSAYSRCTLCR